MGNKIKNVSSSLEEAYKEANQVGLFPVQLTTKSADHKTDWLTDPFVRRVRNVKKEVWIQIFLTEKKEKRSIGEEALPKQRYFVLTYDWIDLISKIQ